MKRRTLRPEPPGDESNMADANSRENETGNAPPQKKEMRSVVLATNAVMFLSFTAMMIYLGLQAFLFKKLGMGDISFGYLQSFVAASQLIGGPVYGRLADIYGTKAVLGLNFVSQTLTYGLTGLSYSLPMAVGARCCSVFLDPTSGAQMAISHAVDSESRAAQLAKLQIWVAGGSTVGNIIAGQSTKLVGEQTTILIGVLLCGLAFLVVIMYIPSFKNETPMEKETEQRSTIKIFSSLLRLPGVLPLLAIRVCCVFPLMAVNITFPLVGMKYFNLTPETSSYFAIYGGVIMMLVSGVVIGQLTKRYSESALMKFGAVSLLICYLIMANATNLTYFIVTIPLEMFGFGLLENIVIAKLTKCAPKSETGSMLGLGVVAYHFSRILAPTSASYIVAIAGFSVFAYFCSAVTAVGMTIIWLYY